MVRRDTIKFENDTLSKNNAKNISFSPEEEVEAKLSWEKGDIFPTYEGNVHKTIRLYDNLGFQHKQLEF